MEFFATKVNPSNVLGNYYKGQSDQQSFEADKQKIERENLLQNLSKEYLAGNNGDSNILSKIAAIDPAKANALQKYNSPSALIGGDSLDNQQANARAQQYMAAGKSPEEATRLAIADIQQSKQTFGTDVEGNVTAVPSRAPLPDIGALVKNATDEQLQSLIKVNNYAEEIKSAPADKKEEAYAKQLSLAEKNGEDVSGFPKTYAEGKDEIEQILEFGSFAEKEFEERKNAVGERGAADIPKAKVKRAEEEAALGAKLQDEIQKEGIDAAASLEGFQKVYDIYNSGFDGGMSAPLKFKAIEAQVALGKELSAEDRLFSQQYSTLKSMADFQVAKSIKVIFGGNISDGEREFAINLQSQPYNIPEMAVAKAAVQEAGALQRLRKNDYAAAWKSKHGGLEKQNDKGESFASFYAKFTKENPIMTPAFIASKGVPVAITKFNNMSVEDVFESLPIGAKFYNPADGRLLTKRG